MKENKSKISQQIGLPPGTLVSSAGLMQKKVKITLMEYTQEKLHEKEIENIEECVSLKETSAVTWINIDGLHDTNVMERTGRVFDVHPLVLESILNTQQRPKCEDYEQYVFIVLKMLFSAHPNCAIDAEQVSVILGTNYVISFQEKEGDVFEPIRERIRNNKGRIRKMGADYLAYALLDAIVDNYFLIIEKLGESIEEVEDELLESPKPKTSSRIHALKREMIFLRKSVWPLREVVSFLENSESKLIKKTTKIYLRNIYDHTIQVIDAIESFRDMVAGMFDIYLTSVSNKMNEVMKVLTVFASIFIPLTFIAGVYGMNFRYMPELNWQWGYFGVLIIMFLIAVLLLVYFKRKKWF